VTVLTANPYEMVAHLILDPKHRCPEGCLCEQLRDIPQIADAIRLIEAAPVPPVE
jgi:hypothetical protein